METEQKTVNVDEVLKGIVDVMNEALEADPQTIQKLVYSRIKCNDKLANHPDIQVNMENEVGILGILCGICQRVTGKNICIQVNDSDTITSFSTL